MTLIRIENASKIYGEGQTTTALADVSFGIEPGEFIAIVGPSGSGKSTLLSLLGSMNPPSSGRVLVDDHDIYQLSIERQADFRRCYLGFVFQQAQLLPYLTALENVALPLLAEDLENDQVAAQEALETVGLGDKLNRLPGELSGGEQSRVAIARALVTRPPILLADEPTGSLDSKTGNEILALLRRLNESGHTIIMVTHNKDAAARATRLISLADGKVDEDHPQFHALSEEKITTVHSANPLEDSLITARDRFNEANIRSRPLVHTLFTLAITSQVLLFLFLLFQALTGEGTH